MYQTSAVQQHLIPNFVKGREVFRIAAPFWIPQDGLCLTVSVSIFSVRPELHSSYTKSSEVGRTLEVNKTHANTSEWLQSKGKMLFRRTKGVLTVGKNGKIRSLGWDWVASKVSPTLRKNVLTASSRVQRPSFLTLAERGHIFLRITDNHFQGDAVTHSGRRNRRSYLHGIRLNEWLFGCLPSWRRKQSGLLRWQRRGCARACVHISGFKTVDWFSQKRR